MKFTFDVAIGLETIANVSIEGQTHYEARQYLKHELQKTTVLIGHMCTLPSDLVWSSEQPTTVGIYWFAPGYDLSLPVEMRIVGRRPAHRGTRNSGDDGTELYVVTSVQEGWDWGPDPALLALGHMGQWAKQPIPSRP